MGFSIALQAQEPVQPEQTFFVQHRPDVHARHFMVATADERASRVGYEVLRQGGRAADAAVAVQFMLNLVEPQSSGIGGGAFVLYWDNKAKKLTAFDGRETAPAAASPAYWLDEQGAPVDWWDAVVGGRSVGVPGTLKLLETLHRRHGRQNWAALIEPTILAAEQGFQVSPRLSASIAHAKVTGRKLDLFPATRAYFFKESGFPRLPGEVLVNPAFAQTLRLIAAEGARAFYEGPLAPAIVAATRTPINPGILEVSDFAAYRVIERDPVCLPYRGAQVCGMGPPSSGGLTVGQILGLLGHMDLRGTGPGLDGLHLLAEASRLAYADRAMYMADGDYVSVPVAGLLDRGYLTARAQLIDPDKAMAEASAGNPPWRTGPTPAPDTDPERPGTSHFSIVDGEGNWLSMTTTIETGFGSRVMVGGFLLNNELTDFSRTPEKKGRPVANRVEGGKRPRSSMAPTLVFRKGAPVLALGSPGGSRIIGYVAQALVALLDWDMTPQAAATMGHIVNRNGATELEAGTAAADFGPALKARGHDVDYKPLNSGLHIIQRLPDGTLRGGADPRREGMVLGE